MAPCAAYVACVRTHVYCVSRLTAAPTLTFASISSRQGRCIISHNDIPWKNIRARSTDVRANAPIKTSIFSNAIQILLLSIAPALLYVGIDLRPGRMDSTGTTNFVITGFAVPNCSFMTGLGPPTKSQQIHNDTSAA